MKIKTILLLAVAGLALAACGNSSASEKPAAAESTGAQSSVAGPPKDVRDVAADSDVSQLGSLCEKYCAPLDEQMQACPTGTTNLFSCTMKLAEGIDLVNELADATAGLDRSNPERYESLDQAIVEARDAFDTWHDHTSCAYILDISDPAFGVSVMEAVQCSAEGAAASYTQATVGAVLKNLAK